MPAGRPNKFQSVDELQKQIDSYFHSCKIRRLILAGVDIKLSPSELLEMDQVTEDSHPTITGLALSLDTTRDVLCDYEEKKAFSNTIKKAKNRVESYCEQRLFGNNVTGVIFNLKNNFGWKDKSEHETYGKDGGAIKVQTLNFVPVSK